MKILFVTMQFGHSYAQGTERYLTLLGDGLRRRGHEVSYLAGDPLHLDPGAPGRFGAEVDGERDLLAYPTRGWMTVMGLPPERLRRWLERRRIDLIHINNAAHIGVGVMVAAEQLGIPVVVTVHDYWWICPKGNLLRGQGGVCDGTPGWRECMSCISAGHHRPTVRRLARLPGWLAPLTWAGYGARAALWGMTPADGVRWTHRRKLLMQRLRAADHVIFPSHSIASVIAPLLGHGRWRVIRSGLEQAWFENPRPSSPKPKRPEDLVIGYAGALATHKAPHLLLRAVRQLGWVQTRVRVAGAPAEQPYWQFLQEEAAGLNVEFIGRLAAADMPAFLRGLDVLAMTSVWPENFPFVVLEAQAASVPVVGSRLGGVIDQIGDERRLFQPGSLEGLAAALEHVRKHPETGPAAVSTADEMTEETLAVYETSKIESRKSKRRNRTNTTV